MKRLRALDGEFDLAVVGGGIVGAGIARDAALRGLRTALVERADFGGGTTAASTRLVHGGLRYLETLDLRLVRLDLRERETLLRTAPHLVRPLPFLAPVYDGSPVSRFKLRAGMLLYDALSFDKSLPGHRFLNAAQTRALEPGLRAEGLRGAALYHDAQVSSPERLVLENIIDAREHGAVALNYVEAVGAEYTASRIAGLRVVDRLTGAETQLRATVVVNASGPWFDRVASRLTPDSRVRTRTTKGIHVACAPLSTHALLLYSPIDGRAMFTIPWVGHSLVGTTDTDFGDDPVDARATPEEIDYVLESAAAYVPEAANIETYWSSAGVRALVLQAGPESRVSRLHQIAEGPPGLISVIGGKLTGYRAIAAETTDRVCRLLGCRRAAETADRPLPGAGTSSSHDYLSTVYGRRADGVRALGLVDPSLLLPISPHYPDIAAQAVFSVRCEQCQTLEDFVLRRSFLGFQADRGRHAAEPASHILTRELDWSEARRLDELARYRSLVARTSTHDSRGAGAHALRITPPRLAQGGSA